MLDEQFISFLSANIKEYEQKSYVLAVSGGMDSMLLLHLFHKYHLKIVVAHCNFQLRGNESDKDEVFLKDWCNKLQIKFYTKRFDTLLEKEIMHEGTQVTARKLRYAWFEDLRKELNFDYVCTAHHLRDNTETLLQRLMNGAYPESMQGIKAIHEFVLRPMLSFDYELIHNYVSINKIEFRIDQSNETLDYTRNKIRHKVLPALKDVFGNNYEERINSVSGIYISYFALLKQEADQILEQRKGWYEINLQKLKYDKGNTALLYEAIKKFGFNWDQCELICRDLNREHGSLFESDDRKHKLYFATGCLQLIPGASREYHEEIILDEDVVKEISLPSGKFLIYRLRRDEFNGFNPLNLYLDFESLRNKKVILRNVWPTDIFTPLGMSHTKTVNEFLKDLKLSPAEKLNQLVLIAGEEVACVFGKRVDEKFKVKDDSEWILVVEFVK